MRVQLKEAQKNYPRPKLSLACEFFDTTDRLQFSIASFSWNLASNANQLIYWSLIRLHSAQIRKANNWTQDDWKRKNVRRMLESRSILMTTYLLEHCILMNYVCAIWYCKFIHYLSVKDDYEKDLNFTQRNKIRGRMVSFKGFAVSCDRFCLNYE